MLLLDYQNVLIQNLLTERFSGYSCPLPASGTPVSIDQVVSDFDGVTFHLSTPESKTKILISIHVKCFKELVQYGAQEVLEREYGPYIVTPEPGYDFSVQIDLENLPAEQEARDELIMRLALLKRNAMAAPFERAFDEFAKLSEEASRYTSESAPQGVKEGGELMAIHYREEEAIYIKASHDRVTVIFSTVFREETDRIFGKVFLQEFVDARRRVVTLQNAPQVLFRSDPPLELQGVPGLQTAGDGKMSYVTFVLFPRHLTPQRRYENISHIQTFRDYFHYHIKASKAYIHTRMRKRTADFLQVLNRARPENEERERKTASGRIYAKQGLDGKSHTKYRLQRKQGMTPQEAQEQTVQAQNKVLARLVDRYGPSLVKLEFMAYDLDVDGAKALGTRCRHALRYLALRFEHPHIRDGPMRPTAWYYPAPGSTAWNLLAGIGNHKNIGITGLETLILERSGITPWQLAMLVEKNPKLRVLKLRTCRGAQPEFLNWLGGVQKDEDDAVIEGHRLAPGAKLEVLWLENCHRLLSHPTDGQKGKQLPDKPCDEGFEWVRSLSNLQTAFQKLFRRRSSQSKGKQPALPDEFEISEHTDGFYKYSQEMLEEKERRLEPRTMRASDSTEASYASAGKKLTHSHEMPPIETPALPYTISSSEWHSFAAREQLLENPYGEAAAEKFGSVLSVFSKVYAIAKILAWALKMYGVELDDAPGGILARLNDAEAGMGTDSLADLIEITERLYYSLYARLVMEIANAELCGHFELDLRRMLIKEPLTLPEASHLRNIFITFKDVLDAPEVCSGLDYDLVKQHQDLIIRHATDKLAVTGFSAHDLIGYRTSTLKIVSNETHPFVLKWRGLVYLYQMPGVETITVMSEKYLTVKPKVTATDDFPAIELPFVSRDSIQPEIWQRENILDNRQATLAKLEGRSVGDIRREDDRRRLLDFVKEKKCICRSSCSCSTECTMDVLLPCPCSERILRVALAKRYHGAGEKDFGPTCGSLARAFFEGLAMVSRGVAHYELVAELHRAMQLFEEVVGKQRHAAAMGTRLV
ncbi:actin-related protein 2/3 complex subunit 2 [Aspergillus thermomutatus]|uniref:Actin-related protein 2/3 complex subunit 2 n=1 Tax=Aspergillus thermomutatus TaxID=41047 RepID=A0A397GDC8_ASPTH|nr:uncharacterized protein CDV56_104144 [Aspergillus thermomutatus]RHZ48129.1 hypothetical protein CDV56_104144 [Aspergillus thermomutatus]